MNRTGENIASQEEMNCERKIHQKLRNAGCMPMGSGEFKPRKPDNKGVKWNKTFGYDDEGTIGEAGTPDALAWRGSQ